MLLKAQLNYLKNKWTIGINIVQVKCQLFPEDKMGFLCCHYNFQRNQVNFTSCLG